MKLTTIIIAKNEENDIADAIDSVSFSDEIIVVDGKSTDRTPDLAKSLGASVISYDSGSFAKQREAGLKAAKSEIVFYLDADERVGPQLKEEIKNLTQSETEIAVWNVNRKNFYFGKYPWPKIEKLTRIFKKEAIKGWRGNIHETPLWDGKIKDLSGELLHYTHNDLDSMTNKTIAWSDIEANNRIEVKHPMITWWRFPRVMIPTFSHYYIREGGYKLGTAGLVESIFQTFSIFVTYAKLWEKQGNS